MALRIPSPKALTKPEAYLAYKAGILSRDELKQNLYNPLNNYEGWLAKWCGLLETYPTNKDGTPQCLTDEEGLLAYLCGVTDRYPASNSRPDDARISAYIRYLVSARYVRPDHPLNREEFYLSLIKTQFIPSGDPSSDIVIDGTAKAPFVDVKMYGDTSQNGTPTPSAPVAIQTVTGLQTVEVHSKNLLPTPGDGTVGGVTRQVNSDGTLSLRGTSVTQWPSISSLPYSLNTTIPGGTVLTLSLTKPLPNGWRLYFREYNVGSSINYLNHSIPNNGTHTTFTTSGEMNEIGLVLLAPAVGATIDIDGVGIQLEVGQTASAFEKNDDREYTIDLGDIQLCGLGDDGNGEPLYEDYIWKDGDDWKVHKATGRLARMLAGLSGVRGNASVGGNDKTTDGVFSISRANWGSDYETTLSNALYSENIGRFVGYQDIPGNVAANSMVDGSFHTRTGTNDRMYFRFARYAEYKTVQEVQDAINADGGVKIVYYLATPTDTVITDTNLIAQLNALKQGGAEEGTTYIKVSATDPNLPAKLYVEAPKYD